jgi:branched-chain amino acid transport system permease protein
VTKLLQLIIDGVALGATYALVALGFVIIYKATGIINYAQGGFVLLGAYFAYNFHQTWDLPFYVALVLAMVGGALLGALVEFLILRHMVGQPPFALIMITIGLLFVIQEVASTIWGFDNLDLGDPWGIKVADFGKYVLSYRNIAALILTTVVLVIFFAFFRYTSMGVAMRASALDQEAALAQGISARRVNGLAWAIAGAVATLAGVILAAGPGQLAPQVQFVALLAFPAIILGGLDSPLGAIVGGVIIGVTQLLVAGYQADYFPWLGDSFDKVAPYVVMILILLVRPYGLFGTKEVRRV